MEQIHTPTNLCPHNHIDALDSELNVEAEIGEGLATLDAMA